jgi:hypothetical protein
VCGNGAGATRRKAGLTMDDQHQTKMSKDFSTTDIQQKPTKGTKNGILMLIFVASVFFCLKAFRRFWSTDLP